MLPPLGVTIDHLIRTKFGRVGDLPNIITHAKCEINWYTIVTLARVEVSCFSSTTADITGRCHQHAYIALPVIINCTDCSVWLGTYCCNLVYTTQWYISAEVWVFAGPTMIVNFWLGRNVFLVGIYILYIKIELHGAFHGVSLSASSVQDYTRLPRVSVRVNWWVCEMGGGYKVGLG